MILGRLPGLALDRTGAAVLGAIALIVGGCLSVGEALGAADAPTLALLFGLMTDPDWEPIMLPLARTISSTERPNRWAILDRLSPRSTVYWVASPFLRESALLFWSFFPFSGFPLAEAEALRPDSVTGGTTSITSSPL